VLNSFVVLNLRFCGYVKEDDDGGDGNEEAPPPPPPPEQPHQEESDRSNPTAKKVPALAVFFSNMGLCTMRTADEINLAGTFATAPAPFKQLVFIQAKQAGKRSVPVVFALLTNKVGTNLFGMSFVLWGGGGIVNFGILTN
jgi:hypothetical protein